MGVAESFESQSLQQGGRKRSRSAKHRSHKKRSMKKRSMKKRSTRKRSSKKKGGFLAGIVAKAAAPAVLVAANHKYGRRHSSRHRSSRRR